MGLPRTIPRGFLAGGMPGRWLVAAIQCLHWACALPPTSGNHIFCPFGLTLFLAVPPPQLLRDINDSWREPRVLVGIVIICWQQFSFLPFRRKAPLWFIRVCARERMRMFRSRHKLPPRWVAWCIRHSFWCRCTRFAAVCACALQSSMLLLCGVAGAAFLIWVFVVVSVVSR